MRELKRDAELVRQFHDIGFRKLNQRRSDVNARSPLDTGFCGQVAHSLEGMNEFGAAIRVSGIIERVHADEDLVRFEHLRPGQCEGKKYRVARGHVGDWNLSIHRALVPAFGNVDLIGKCGVAEYPKIDLCDAVIGRAKCARNAARGFQFNPVPLAVVERQGVTVEPLAPGKCETGGGIESPAK